MKIYFNLLKNAKWWFKVLPEEERLIWIASRLLLVAIKNN